MSVSYKTSEHEEQSKLPYTIQSREEMESEWLDDPETIKVITELQELDNTHQDEKLESEGDIKKMEEIQKNETKDALDVGVGSKETVSLGAKSVEVLDVSVEEQKDKQQKRVGDKIIIACKHPDKDEPIKISSVKYEKNNNIKVSGIWFNKDEEGMIQKGSALALMMQNLNVKTLSELKGETIPTAIDEKGYLCIKAY